MPHYYTQNPEDMMRIYAVNITVSVSGRVQSNTMQAPRIMIEQEFLSIYDKIRNIRNVPVLLSITCDVECFDEMTRERSIRQNEIKLTNDLYNAQ